MDRYPGSRASCFSRSLFRRSPGGIARAAGRAEATGERMPAIRTLAEPLESRLLLAGFNPGGENVVATVMQGATTLSASDVSIFDIGSGAAEYDRVRITGDVGLNGVLRLNFRPGFSLTQNSTFDIIARSAGTGNLSGAFLAIQGLTGPAGSPLDLVAIQSPSGLRLVATDLPVQNLTIAAATSADADALTSLFLGGSTDGLTASSTFDGVIHAMSHLIDGRLTFTEFTDDNGLPAVSIAVGPRDLTPGRVTATVANLPAATVFGSGTWTLRDPGPPVMPPPDPVPPRIDGLRLASFTPTGFSLTALYGNLDSPASDTIVNGQIGPMKFTFLQAIAPEFTVATFEPSGGGPVEDRASVAVGFSVQTVDLSFTSGSQSGVTAKITLITNLSLGFQSRFDGTTFSPGTASGRFTLEARRFELEVPNVVKIMSSARIFVNYDPNDPAPDQLLVAITTLSVEVPKLRLKALLDSPVDATSEGLKIYRDGFKLGLLNIALDTSTFNGGAPLDSRGYLQIGSAFRVKEPRLISNRFEMRFNPGGGLALVAAESFGLGAMDIRIGPDAPSEYFAKATNLSFELTFPPGPLSAPDGFRVLADSIEFHLGPFIEVNGNGIRIDTGAADNERMIIIDGNLSVKLKLGSLFNRPPGSPNSELSFAAGAGGFAIKGDGSFEPFSSQSEAPFNANPFHVDLAFDLSNATDLLSGVKLPAFLRTFTDASGMISVRWPNFTASPERFLMQLTFDLTGGTPETALFNFRVENLTVDTARLGVGPDSSPFIFVSSVTGSLTTRIMGTQFAGTFILGVAPFNAQGEALDPQADVIANPDLVARSVIYAGARGEFRFPNNYGVQLMFGFSELGFLQAYMVLDAPIVIDPVSGLSISGFRGGVTFNAPPFPTIDDPAMLRSGLFKPTRKMRPDEWESRLGLYVANQLGGNPGFLFRITNDQINSRYPADGGLSGWISQLDSTDDPGLVLPAGLRNELFKQGFSFATKANLATTVQLDAADLWLLNDRGQEYVIRRNRNDTSISVYSIGFSIANTDSMTDAFSSLTAVTGDTVAGSVPGLIDAFAAKRIVVPPSAVVRVLTQGLVWELDIAGSKFRLEKMGTTGAPGDFGSLALIVTGGNGAFGAADTVRIEAGFTLFSQYATSNAVKILADAVVDPTGKFLLSGEMLFGDTTAGGGDANSLRVESKMYFDLSNISAANAQVFLLTDVLLPTSTVPILSLYGKLAFAFYKRGAGPNGTDLKIDAAYLAMFGVPNVGGLFTDANPDNNPDYFRLELSGSEMFGIAVFDAAGVPAFSNFAVQRFILGGKPITPLESGRNQYGYAAISWEIAQRRMDFEFDASLSAQGLIAANSIVSAAGRFVLDFENTGGDLRFKEFFGAAKLRATLDDIEPLKLAGITGDFNAFLKVNTAATPRSLTLLLPNNPPAPLTIRGQSFGFFVDTALTFRAPGVVGDYLHQEIVGAFALEVDNTGFQLFMLGSAPLPIPVVGTLYSPVQAEVLGVMLVRRNASGEFRFATRFELAIQDDVNAPRYFRFQMGLQFFLNTFGTDQSYTLPADFSERFTRAIPDSLRARLDTNNDGVNEALSIVVPAGAPRIFWTPQNMNTDAPGSYFAVIGVGSLVVFDPGSFGAGLSIVGGIRLRVDEDQISFDIKGQITIAPLGSFSIDETLPIYAVPDGGGGAGPSGSVRYETWGSLALNGSISVGQLQLLAALSLDINTSSQPRNVQRFYNPATREVIPLDQMPVDVMIPGRSVIVFAGGDLRWNGTSLIAGELTFAATPQGLSMTVGAVLNLQPLTGVSVTGALELLSSGNCVGYLNVAAGFAAVGFRFDGNAYLKLNTLDTEQTLNVPFTGGRTIGPNTFEIYVNGDLRLTMFGEVNLLSLHGEFWLSNTASALSVRAVASLSLLDFFGSGPLFSIAVNGFANIYKQDRVLTLSVGVAVPTLQIPHLIRLESTGTSLKLNTGPVERDGIAPGIRIDGSLTLRVVGLELATVTTSIAYEPTAAHAAANGAWHLAANLSVDFFSIFSLSGSIDIYSRGAFRFVLSGTNNFGSEYFGATFTGNMTLDYRAQNAGSANELEDADLFVNASFSGTLFAGKTVAGRFYGLRISGSGTFTYDGPSRRLSVYAEGEFPWPVGRRGGTFYLGTLDFRSPPPPPRLAGPLLDEAWPDQGGVLYLNVGARSGFRNFLEAETAEDFTVEAITVASGGRQTIRVRAFGITQEFANVTSIVADFGVGGDALFAGVNGIRNVGDTRPITIPITVTGGDEADTIVVRSRGTVGIFGNDGSDDIRVSGSAVTVDAGAGDDTIAWLVLAGSSASSATLDGGVGTNSLEVVLTDEDDVLRIEPAMSGGGLLVRRWSAAQSLTDSATARALQSVYIEAGRGADHVRIAALDGTGLNSLVVDPSQYETGNIITETVTENGISWEVTRAELDNDTDPDRLFIEGRSAADSFTLATAPDQFDSDRDLNTTEVTLTVTRPGVGGIVIFNASRTAGDELTIESSGGDDVIVASLVSVDFIALILDGGADNDTITGSPFADRIFAGPGRNTVYGGDGPDTITAGDGDDTIDGQGGDDQVQAGNGNNTVYGGGGHDRLTTGSGNDHLDGGPGNDTLIAGAGRDTLIGGEGDDALDGGLGDDTYTGGLGNDTFADAGGRDTLIETRAAGAMTLTDSTFIVGTLTPGGGGLFADMFTAAGEFELLHGIFEAARLTGGASGDTLIVGDVDGKVRIAGVLVDIGQQFHGAAELIGGDGGDRYIVTIFGTAASVITIVESPSGSGADSLDAFGSNLTTRGDTFLLRRNFLAALPPSLDDRGPRSYDRVNYPASLESGLTIHGLLGDDTFVSDDNGVAAVINGGGGSDFFQVGQLFGSDRVVPNVALGDEIGTTQVDLTPADAAGQIIGFLTNGATRNLVMNGGDGADRFVVFRNVAAIDLNGQAGDDTFTIRAFILASAGSAARIAGGTGTNSIEYTINALVEIDGGEGIDAVRVLGTQVGDTFVIDENGVAGAGLNSTFEAIEILELHTGDGDDSVYILATPNNLRVMVFGGAGSDRFYITGVAPEEPTRSNELSRIVGPVLIEGGPGDVGVFGLTDPIMVTGERNIRLPANAGVQSSSENPGDVDTLDIISTDATLDAIGFHSASIWPDGGAGIAVQTLSGLGMGPDLVQQGQTTPGGISYRRLEIVDVQLGSGAETLSISSVAASCTTVFRGNGGNDGFTFSAEAQPNAMVVIFGDNAADVSHTGAPGHDVVDASMASQGLTAYGGAGVDTLLGGSGPDRLFGGSASDVIGGGGGDDLILGDSGIRFDRQTRITAVLTTGMAALDNLDLVGADIINPGDGDDTVFGDHGLVQQFGGMPGVIAASGAWSLLRTVNVSIGGNDLISARADANPAFNRPGAPALAGGNNLVFGGLGVDTIILGGGDDAILGDHGSISLTPTGSLMRIESTDPLLGAGESIDGGAGNDRIIAGTGSDAVDGGAGDDVIFGDHGLFDFSLPANANFVALFIGAGDGGAADTVYAGSGHDIVLGQQGDDLLLGQDGDDDLIGGHNVAGGADELDLISGFNDRIDGGAGHDVIAGDNAVIIRIAGGGARFRTLSGPRIYMSDGSLQVTDSHRADPRGVQIRSVSLLDHDPAALVAGSVFGHDQIAGNSGDDLIFGQLGDDQLRGDGVVSMLVSGETLLASPDPTHDGDDYIEGNGGADSIWGDLGRDDIIGGSSDQFGLSTASQRIDGADVIFGGDGTRTSRNHAGDTSASGHASDSDFIVGDNASIFRLLTAGGAFHVFNYDTYSASARLLPRGVLFLDYDPHALAASAGAADQIRGESGDDTIHGMTGDDTLYGDGQDDDITGGLGNDWIYGGTGIDALLGDDGLVATSRNGTAEPLHGLNASAQETVSVPGLFSTTIFTAGALQKSATLLGYSVGGDDVIFAGLGDDFAHGGEGNDAISGAEALNEFYNLAGSRPSLVYSPNLRRFTIFDPGTGLRRISGFFLNFDASISNVRIDDGRDTLFGDHGHDWIVGGTNQDRIYGGMGDDVLNADDNLATNSGLNFSADTAPYNEPDIAFGGGGLDRLIGNTATDRLIDWVDEFNQYLTPFTAGSPTVTRNPTAAIITALRSLGRGGGADQLLLEPHGELGLVQSTDAEWSDQLARPIVVQLGPTTWLPWGDSSTPRSVPPPAPHPGPKLSPSAGPAAEDLYTFEG